MLSVQRGGKNSSGWEAKSMKSAKQVKTIFVPPSHPAIIITSAFGAPHIAKLKSALEEHYIAYGMQTSKKKVNRPPGSPTNKNFIICDDSTGPPILEGQFIGLKMCRVDYPRANNINDVIKKFDKYIGLGKENQEVNQEYEETNQKYMEEGEDREKYLQAINKNKQGGGIGVGGFKLGSRLQLGDLQNAVQIKDKIQDFRDCFRNDKSKSMAYSQASRAEYQAQGRKAKGQEKKKKKSKNKKQNSNGSSSETSSQKNKNRKQKLQSKGKRKSGQKMQNNDSRSKNIKLKSISKYGEQKRDKNMKKRTLFLLSNPKQSQKYAEYLRKFGDTKNKRIIIIKSLSEYYRLCYEKGEGENCLLLGPNVAFKQLHKFRNLNNVYIYGDDPKFCAQLVKGNIKKAAITPAEMDQILIEQGFDKNEQKQFVPPERWQGNIPKQPLQLQNSKNQKSPEKPSLFDRFKGYLKGKKKPETKPDEYKIKDQVRKKSKSTSSSSSRSSSSSSSSKKSSSSSSSRSSKQKRKIGAEAKQKSNQPKGPLSPKQNQLVSIGRIIEGSLRGSLKSNDNPLAVSTQKGDAIKAPSRRIVKLKTQQKTPEVNTGEQKYAVLGKPPQIGLLIQSIGASKNSDKSLKTQNPNRFERNKGRQFSVSINPPKQEVLALKTKEPRKRKSSEQKKIQFTLDPTIKQEQNQPKKSSMTSSSQDEQVMNSKKPINNVKKTNKNEKQVEALIKSSQKQIDMFELSKPKPKTKQQQQSNRLYHRNAEVQQDRFENKQRIKQATSQVYNKKVYKANVQIRPVFHEQKQNQVPQSLKLASAVHHTYPQLSKQQLYQLSNNFNPKNIKKSKQAVDPVECQNDYNFYSVPTYPQSKAPKQDNAQFILPQPTQPIRSSETPVNVYAQPVRIQQPFQLKNPNIPTVFPNNMSTDPRLVKSLSGGQLRGYTPNFKFNLPFDEKNFDKFVQNGITVYRPKKGPSFYPLQNQFPKQNIEFVGNAMTNPTKLICQPQRPVNMSPPSFNAVSTAPGGFWIPGKPMKETTSTYASASGSIPFNQYPTDRPTKNPSISTYDFVMKRNQFPIQQLRQAPTPVKRNRNQNPVGDTMYRDVERHQRPNKQFDNYSSVSQKPIKSHHSRNPSDRTKKQKPHRNKQNQNYNLHNQYFSKPINKLTKTRQAFDSFDSDISQNRDKKYHSLSQGKNWKKSRDPLSSILDQTSSKVQKPTNKNYSVLYLINTKLSPKIIKQLFQLCDSSDTIQTYSQPQKMREIIEKAENIFDFVIVFNSDQQANSDTKGFKGLYHATYQPQANQSVAQNKLITLRKVYDLQQMLIDIYLEKTHKHSRDNTIGSIYYKDFNRPIRDMTKILKKQYPNVQIRKYFSIGDLPTKLPNIKGQVTIILIDEVSFEQFTQYCSQQQKQNPGILKICIPKSQESIKMCRNQPGTEKMVWLTERQLDDPEFLIRRIHKRIFG